MAQIRIPRRLARWLQRNAGSSTDSGDLISGTSTGNVNSRFVRRGQRFPDIAQPAFGSITADSTAYRADSTLITADNQAA